MIFSFSINFIGIYIIYHTGFRNLEAQKKKEMQKNQKRKERKNYLNMSQGVVNKLQKS